MTDEQNNQYKYYKKAVKYIAEYEDIQDFDAVKSMIYDKSNIPEINSARDGLNYEIMYTDGEIHIKSLQVIICPITINIEIIVLLKMGQ